MAIGDHWLDKRLIWVYDPTKGHQVTQQIFRLSTLYVGRGPKPNKAASPEEFCKDVQPARRLEVPDKAQKV